MKNLLILKFLAVLLVLTGCQSNRPIENSFDPDFLSGASDLIFTSPNFSPLHTPPLMSGLAYVEVFDKKDYCTADEPATIGKVTITRSNKTQYSKLPTGDVVALVAYYAVGATGGGLKGGTYYSFVVAANSKYKITLTESRPFVTSYSVSIEQIVGDNDPKLVSVVEDRKNICAGDS